jgi:hypothetical protein
MNKILEAVNNADAIEVSILGGLWRSFQQSAVAGNAGQTVRWLLE